MAIITPFWTRPEPQTFVGPDAATRLRRALERKEADTLVTDLNNPATLRLDSRGRTALDGAMLTSAVLRGVCQRLGAGLKDLMDDLTLGSSKGGAPLPEQAALIYNSLLEKRFAHRLEDRILVRDTRLNVYEGLSTIHYQRLPNLDFFETASDMMDDADPPLRFESATLVGRWLTLHFAGVEPVFSPTVRKQSIAIMPGVFLVNTETGETTLRVARSLSFRDSGLRCLLPYRKMERVAHSGRNFQQRWRGAIRRALRREPDAPFLKWSFEKLTAQPLGFGGVDDDVDDRVFRDLVAQFSHLAVPKALSRRCLKSALRWPAGVERSVDGLTTWNRSAWKDATALDLFYAAIREAALLSVYARERLELSAYRLLTAKTLL